MYSVNLNNVTKRWGDVTAVDQVNLHINEGEFVVLLGPSGCGKTTTMRLVAGLEDITEGDIKIGDEVISGKGVPPNNGNTLYISEIY